MKNLTIHYRIWNIFAFYIYDPKCCLRPQLDALVQEIIDHLSEFLSSVDMHFLTTQWKI